MQIKTNVEKRYAEINLGIKRIENQEENFPPGCLSIKGKQQAEYYNEYIDKDGNKKSIYIKNSNRSLARGLAMKAYYKDLKKFLLAEQKAMERFIKDYHPEKKYDLYDKMKPARKALIKPMFVSIEETVDAWRNETYEKSAFHSENLKHESNHGEMMRSKSEVIIASLIDTYPELEYRYEKPLYLLNGANQISPDFTIINTKTGKIYYLEHIGMLTDSDYAEKFVYKINLYTKNNLRMGVDVFFTFESQEYGLDKSAINRILNWMAE